MESLQTQLLQQTFTAAVLHRRVGLVQSLVERTLFQSGEASQTSITDRYRSLVAEIEHVADRTVLEACGVAWLSSLQLNTAQQQLQELRAWLDTLPTMTVYVPTQFSDADARPIGEWCRAELDERLLLQLEIDPGVVGGCAFVWNHTYHDYSLASRLQQQPDLLSTIIADYA